MLFSTLLKNSITEKEKIYILKKNPMFSTYGFTKGFTIYIGKQNGNKFERFLLSACPKAIKK